MTTDALEFSCPRCEQPVQAEFYGPCDDCRSTLRAAMRSEARTVEQEGFVPSMHVTPNAVALKDD